MVSTVDVTSSHHNLKILLHLLLSENSLLVSVHVASDYSSPRIIPCFVGEGFCSEEEFCRRVIMASGDTALITLLHHFPCQILSWIMKYTLFVSTLCSPSMAPAEHVLAAQYPALSLPLDCVCHKVRKQEGCCSPEPWRRILCRGSSIALSVFLLHRACGSRGEFCVCLFQHEIPLSGPQDSDWHPETVRGLGKIWYGNLDIASITSCFVIFKHKV